MLGGKGGDIKRILWAELPFFSLHRLLLRPIKGADLCCCCCWIIIYCDGVPPLLHVPYIQRPVYIGLFYIFTLGPMRASAAAASCYSGSLFVCAALFWVATFEKHGPMLIYLYRECIVFF